MSGIVWLALDGVGHPLDAPPGSVWEQDLPVLRPLVGAGLALDTTLGVPGLPQSGTGQACWLTGTDAVALMGEHYGPHPGPTLQRLLRAHALPVRLARAGARVALANHYVPAYFEAQGQGEPRRRNRMGCFPFSFQAAGLLLNPPDVPGVGATLGLDFRAPWAPSGSLDGLRRLGGSLARAALAHDLIVADLWFGDLLGHQGDRPAPPGAHQAGQAYLARLDALLDGLLAAGARVGLTADHGNLENLDVKAHTLARVPFAGADVELGSAADVVQGGQAIAGWFGLEPVEAGEF